jgi:hypothetical protein
VALHPAAKSGPGGVEPPVEELRQINSIITTIPPEEWDLVRPLASWTAASESGAGAQPEVARGTTNAEGKFSVDVPRTGGRTFRLTASKDGVGSAAMAEVAAGASVDLVLGNAAKIGGSVVTAVDSKPVGGAVVVFSDGAKRFTATTKDDGAFEVDAVPPGYYEVTVSAKGLTPLFDRRFQVQANSSPITLQMPRGTTVRIRAELEEPGTGKGEGSPIKDAQVVLIQEDMRAYVTGRTNAEGVVEFPGIPGGDYTANALAAGVVSQSEENFKVDPDNLVQEVVIAFEPAVMTEITVVDEDGRPMAGVDFYGANGDEAYDALRSSKMGVSDADGKLRFAFEFDGPRCTLYGFKKDYALVQAYPDQFDSGDPIRLVMKKAATLRGRVVTTDGKPIADAEVTIDIMSQEEGQGFEDTQIVVRTDASGNYHFPYLPRVDGISASAMVDGAPSEEDHEIEVSPDKSDYEANFTIDLSDQPSPPPRLRPVPPK